MTARLEHAVRQLSPEDVKAVEDYAEALAARQRPNDGAKHFGLDWVGKGAEAYSEQSGVDAAHAASRAWLESIERSLSNK